MESPANSFYTRFGGSRAAFTIIEALLALSIVGIIMVAACAMMFNMAGIMESLESDNPFSCHVDRVERFLRERLQSSRFSKFAPESLRGKILACDMNVSLSAPPGGEHSDALKICFGVSDDHPAFVCGNGFSGEIVCWLDFSEDGGLSVLWCPAKKDSDTLSDDQRPVYRTKISEYVKRAEYLYNFGENGGWKTEDEIRSGGETSTLLPAFLRLEFSDGKESCERYIPIFSVADASVCKPYSYTKEPSAPTSNSSGRGGGGSSSNASGRRGGGSPNSSSAGGRGGGR